MLKDLSVWLPLLALIILKSAHEKIYPNSLTMAWFVFSWFTSTNRSLFYLYKCCGRCPCRIYFFSRDLTGDDAVYFLVFLHMFHFRLSLYFLPFASPHFRLYPKSALYNILQNAVVVNESKIKSASAVVIPPRAAGLWGWIKSIWCHK